MKMKMKNKLGKIGLFTKMFVMNSKLTLLLIIFFFIWGIFSFIITPKQYNPDIVAPAFNIITDFPGATVKEVDELLTKPMEDALMDIDGVDEVFTQSISGARSILTVKFFVGEDMEKSKIKLIQKLNDNMQLLPMGATAPYIKSIDPDNVPIITLALSSDKIDGIKLRELAFKLNNKIKLIKNTSNIEIKGGLKKEMSILIDPYKLNAYSISIAQIKKLIQANNLRSIGTGIKNDNKNIKLEVDGVIKNEEDLKNLILINQENNKVYLKDVAEIKDSYEEINSYSSLKLKNKGIMDVVYISIAKKKGTNIMKISKDVLDFLDSAKENIIPPYVDVHILRNEGLTASNEINKLVINLFQAIAIVAFILFLFLDKRPAFIVAIVIPLTLAIVFALGFLVGQTINRITLFALILSLGMLVDNATVVVENILRHIKKDKKSSIKNIVITAVDEVAAGLLMSTVTTVLALFQWLLLAV